ncbi:MAG: hypothetical protein ACD_38C00035G0009 [uncultured bacterium]|uniref:Prepilin-type cleavage/methylation n=1 Tax=Candidatus Daviesbacteria bacterium GW2011_GWC2_40_12 TaxID=1618431 RepID=A0A0G0QLU4_9BACT|nr:MAG: hypothetical protein ACD_38C00035G0009 [uncultured bacterium]KKR41419.1 MAG: Prepilin-type cleavage/methylation [Candidatus Daviesbacteria bacterium GW2011_GWC2_40_12]OGE21024.1 MAG: hypothetical protein A2778_02205 [Candidatus Daviesbacteria bacterium RIFCSPHIGHO2_01_FULL_40_24]OGE29144.1 MAG: hypothetical protein A3C29_04905 [Candidatus Daviesbacteria bacterium RIFCSPHIGHO2_02_FULL_40_16]OGE43099.1 MAG: hypothetical protein A3A53_00910 [Candidatus Daviesbacteria bacterium RIFCSPLOWO2_
MKKLLPKTANNPKGFTLIELLIVVTIIAVLSAIGYAVYANLGLQAKSRNDRRKADIDAISKALEVNKIPEGNYAELDNAQFSNGIVPTDPGTSTSYCVTVTATNVTASNPSAWGACSAVLPANEWSTVADAVPATTVQWKACAWLEAEVNPTKAAQTYCRRNSQ